MIGIPELHSPQDARPGGAAFCPVGPFAVIFYCKCSIILLQ
jgi:hypothetical protein